MAAKPPASDEPTRVRMARQRRADTRPELALRHELHARGLRYRVGVRTLPGTPDIVFAGARIAIFVDGCFWHRCPIHGSVPKANREWWVTKLDANVERDRRQDAALATLGWTVRRFWEHELLPGEVGAAVEEIVRLREHRLSIAARRSAGGQAHR